MKPYYDDGTVTIYHGDALHVLAALPDASIDFITADPPYSSGGAFRGDRVQTAGAKYHTAKGGLVGFTGDTRDQHAYQYWMALWLTEARRVLQPSEIITVFTDWRQLAPTSDALQAGGFIYRGVVVWDKTSTAKHYPGRYAAQAEFVVWGTNGARGGNAYEWALRGVFSHQAPRNAERVHMTQKPEPLLRDLCQAAPAAGVVLDPFMGSGTSLVAARAIGRRAIGVDLDERNCEAAAERVGQHVLDLGEAA
jgi:site-specific DNA-methyltransferase (adenine-specific)